MEKGRKSDVDPYKRSEISLKNSDTSVRSSFIEEQGILRKYLAANWRGAANKDEDDASMAQFGHKTPNTKRRLAHEDDVK